MEKQLKRLESLNDIQLMAIFASIDKYSAPQHIKNMVINKINDILNDRLDKMPLQGEPR